MCDAGVLERDEVVLGYLCVCVMCRGVKGALQADILADEVAMKGRSTHPPTYFHNTHLPTYPGVPVLMQQRQGLLLPQGLDELVLPLPELDARGPPPVRVHLQGCERVVVRSSIDAFAIRIIHTGQAPPPIDSIEIKRH